MLRKLRRAHATQTGYFYPAYLGGSNKLKASLEFLYGLILSNEFMKSSGEMALNPWNSAQVKE